MLSEAGSVAVSKVCHRAGSWTTPNPELGLFGVKLTGTPVADWIPTRAGRQIFWESFRQLIRGLAATSGVYERVLLPMRRSRCEIALLEMQAVA